LLNAWGLALNKPTAGEGFRRIVTDGPADISWTVEEGDPKLITLQLQNNVTLDSFELARDVDVSAGSVTVYMEDVPRR
jgi:hypothetical protein